MIFVDLVFAHIATFLDDKDAISFSSIDKYTYEKLSKYVEIKEEMDIGILYNYQDNNYHFKFRNIYCDGEFLTCYYSITYPSGVKSLTIDDDIIESLDEDGFIELVNNLPSLLEELWLSTKFNWDINIPNSVTNLSMGIYEKANPILYLPLCLIKFSNYTGSFHSDTILPDSLTSLHLAGNYPIHKLPKILTELCLFSGFNHEIQNLPNTITHLTLYNQKIINLPSSLIKLEFEDEYIYPIVNLPNTITYLKLGYHSEYPIQKFPDNIQQILVVDFMSVGEGLINKLQQLEFIQYTDHQYQKFIKYIVTEKGKNLMMKYKNRIQIEGIDSVLEDFNYFDIDSIIDILQQMGIGCHESKILSTLNVKRLRNKLEDKIRVL